MPSTIDAQGKPLTAALFIEVYHAARNLAPPRFLTLRLNPARLEDLNGIASIPEVVHVGPTPGPLGKKILRVQCVRAPEGVSDGIAIETDEKMDATKLSFEIHGIEEMAVVNLG